MLRSKVASFAWNPYIFILWFWWTYLVGQNWTVWNDLQWAACTEFKFWALLIAVNGLTYLPAYWATWLPCLSEGWEAVSEALTGWHPQRVSSVGGQTHVGSLLLHPITYCVLRPTGFLNKVPANINIFKHKHIQHNIKMFTGLRGWYCGRESCSG